jgi:hypothetical protein
MGVKAVRALLTAAPNLEELHAEENNYGSAPSRFIAASKEMRKLRVLTLREPEVGPLATSAAAQELEEVDLQVCSVDEEAAHALAALPNLEIVHLTLARCDQEARAILRRRFGPNLTVYGDGGHEWDKLPGPP